MNAIHDAPTAPGRLPGLGHGLAMLNDPLGFMQRIRAHGRLVRIFVGGLPVLVLNHPEDVYQALVVQSDGFDRGRMAEKMRVLFGSSLATLDSGKAHLTQRRLMQPAFSRSMASRYVDLMQEQVLAQIGKWTPGDIIDVNDEFSDLALRIAARVLLGLDLSDAGSSSLLKLWPRTTQGIVVQTLLPNWIAKLPFSFKRHIDKTFEEIDEIVKRAVPASLEKQDGGDCLLETLVAMRDPDTGIGMSTDQLRDEIFTLLLAGTATSASALAWLFYELASNPEAERTLHREIDGMYRGGAIDAGRLTELDYTHRAIHEILRLHSPASFLMRRTRRAVTLNGLAIPSGMDVLVSPYVMHRDPALYAEPRLFDPDRSTGDKALPRGAYLPFGLGAHQCLGRYFALTELCVAIVAMASRWRLRLLPENRIRESGAAFVVRPSGLRMRIEARGPSGSAGH